MLEAGLFRSPRWLPSFLGVRGGLAGGLLFIGIGVLVGVDAVKGTQGVATIASQRCTTRCSLRSVFFLVARTIGRATDVRDAWSIR